MLNLVILKLGFPCHDVADDVTNLNKFARMINDKCQNLKNYINLTCKMDQIGIVDVANTIQYFVWPLCATGCQNSKIQGRTNDGSSGMQYSTPNARISIFIAKYVSHGM